MKFWCFITLMLIFYSINVLISEKYRLAYRLVKNDKEKKSIQYATCKRLSELLEANKTEFTFKQLKFNLKIYFNRLNFTDQVNRIVSSQIKKKKYFVLRNFVCLIVNEIDKLRLIHRISNNDKCYALNIKNYMFFRFDCQSSLVKQRIIQFKQYPYSKCSHKAPNRFKCVQDCIIKEKGQNLSKYYYDRNGNGNRIIHLKYQYNKTVIQNEETCLEKCKKKGKNCKSIYFEPKYDNSDEQGSKTLFFKAYRLIRKLTFCLHFVGLIFLILNISLNHLLSIPIKLLKTGKFKKFLELFKFSVLLILLFVLCIQLIRNHFEKIYQPNRKEITTRISKPEPINLVLCFPFSVNLTDYLEIKSKRLVELENETSSLFYEYVSDICIEYQDQKSKIEWSINKSKVYFKNGKRCFLVHVKPYEVKYQSLLSISKLVIEFIDIDNKSYDLFLLANSEKFNSKSYRNDPRLSFVKRVIKRSKTSREKKCIDYKEGRINEIDKCVNKEMVKYGNISAHYNLIDKDHFELNQYESLYLDYDLEYNFTFYDIKKTECRKMYEISECKLAYFESGYQIDYIPDNVTLLDLYYNTVSQIEEELSTYKLMLEMLNIQSILFNFNIFELVSLVFFKFNTKFRINLTIFCLIGLTFHIQFIFYQVIKEDLIFSQYYKLSEKIDFSNLIFCFETDQARLLDPDHVLNYKYLDEITKELNFRNVFKEIVYLNESNKWTWIDLDANFSDFFRIDTFYFLDNKCFQIELQMTYRRDQFEFKEIDENQVLKINFNLEFLSKENYSKHHQHFTYFFTKLKSTMQFSSMIELNYFSNYLTYSRLFEIEYYDKFNLLKNPISIYGDVDVNDVNKYVKNLIDKFKKNYHLRTLNLPIEKDGDDNIIIDNNLFIQFYLQIQSEIDISLPVDLNFKRLIYTNYLEKNQIIDYNFIFILAFFKKIILVTNQGSYSDILVNLLNVASIWLGLCFLDLYVFVYKIRFIFIGLCKLLLKIEYQLIKLG